MMAPAGDDIGVVDRDDQSDKWEQKTGVVVGVGSLSWHVDFSSPYTS